MPSARPGEVPLERLSSSSQLTEQQKVDEVSRQFEAILLRQIFSAAQKPMLNTPGVSSTSTGIYQDMITEQLANSVSSSGALGLATSLSRELGRQLGVDKTTNEPAIPASHQ